MLTIALLLAIFPAVPFSPCQRVEPICGFGCAPPVSFEALACFLENEAPNGIYARCTTKRSLGFCILPD